MSTGQRDSKITIQKLDLPKGGGAIEGIGEKFEANGFTGTSTLSLPIYASPCRDFTPSLSLSYNSGGGNGCFGMGWEPSLAKISRKTSKGLPHYNSRDTFLYGGEDLVPIEGRTRKVTPNGISYFVQQYYVRTESSFELIEYWQVPEGTRGSHSFWKITHANHMISIFGKRTQAVIADPSSPNKIFEWLLEENYNPTGDHQLFFYKEENDQNVPPDAVYEKDRVVTANKYIQFIRYGYKDPVDGSMLLRERDHQAIQDANKGDWHFEIVFDYGEYDIDAVIAGKNLTPYRTTGNWHYRPDPFSMYRATFEIRTMRRCFHTLCFHRFPEELGTTEPVLVKASRYAYEIDDYSSLSQLKTVEETGFYYDSTQKQYSSKRLPPLELEYQAFEPTGHSFTEIKQESDRPQPGMEQAPYHFVDLYGEGISGILYVADNAAYYQEPILTPKNGSTNIPKLNSTDLAVPAATSTLSYAPPKRLSSFPLAPTIQSGELALRNVTGDGQLDLVIASDAIKGFYEIHGVEGWQDYREFAAFPADYHQTYQEFGDLTGKGLADLMLLNGNEVRVYPSRKGEGFGNALFASHSVTATATLPPRLEKTEQEFTTLMDISGNGTPDIVRVRQNDITYWPSLGYGKFDKPITMGKCPDLGADFNTQRLFFADLDGSGSKDLLYFYLDHVKIYFNQSGNAWSDPIELPFPSDILQFSDLDQISFADLFARGTTCLVLSKDNAFPAPKRWYYDFGRQQKP
ncbi:MAG: SpvB/TcaC N-terminal domain-containing protein, partial [Crocosphaera sp.]